VPSGVQHFPATDEEPVGVLNTHRRKVHGENGTCSERRLLAPSVTAWAHMAFPELRADRPYHQPGDDSTLGRHPTWALEIVGDAEAPHPFFALTEIDSGMRGCPSGRRHNLSDAGTKLDTPRQGKTSCS
jgi:hypothetical protein